MVCWATETSMNNIFNMGNLLLALGILVSISAFVCLYYAYKEEKRDSARAKKAAKTRAKNRESKETLIEKTVSKPSNKKKTKSKKSK